MTPEENTRSRFTIALSILALAVVVFQTAQLFRIIDRFAVDVPFWDQWGFYNAFFTPHSPWEVFSWQHGPHRQGAGAFIMQAINSATDWNQRAQAFMIGVVMTAAAAAFLLLKRRLFGSLQWYDAIPVLMIVSLRPMEIYLGALNVSHAALPLLLSILLCLALTIHNILLRYCFVVVLYFLSLFTGFGLLVGPVLPVLLIIDFLQSCRGKQWGQARSTAVALICCLAAIACFLHDYSSAHTVQCLPAGDEPWYHYPIFMAIMFSVAALPGKFTTLPSIAIGLIIFAALHCMLAVTIMKLRSQDPQYQRHQVIFLLIALALVFSATTAAGRLSLGLEAATPTRYVPLIMPGFIGAYLFLLKYPALVRHRPFMLLLFAAAVFAMLTGWPWHRYPVGVYYQGVKQSWVAAFKQTGEVSLADTLSGYAVHPHPERTGLARKLEWLRANNYSLFRDSTGAPD